MTHTVNATKTVELPTLGVLSVTTGMLLCPFEEFHRVFEILAGRPVWTHEMASDGVWQPLKQLVQEQRPDVAAVVVPPMEAGEVHAVTERLLAQFGPTLTLVVPVRSEERDAAAQSAMLEGLATGPLADKAVILVEAETGAKS